MTVLEKVDIDAKIGANVSTIGFESHFSSPNFSAQTSYSHGLEKIYALENVDPKSIRRIAPRAAPKANAKPKKRPELIQAAQTQYEFDFGPEFREVISSFVPREPIQVLGLLKHAEKSLLDNNKTRLGDLLDVNLQDFIFLKGMGQGHIEEIGHKLSQYLEGKSTVPTETLDFGSWIRILSFGIDRKKAAAALNEYGLADLLPLSLSENLELNRLSEEQKKGYANEAFAYFRTQIESTFFSDIKEITTVFIKPWLRRRLGFATQQEIIERVERVSKHSETAIKAVHLLTALLGRFPLESELIPIEKELFAVDNTSAERFFLVMEKANSYFYKPQTCYPLGELVVWIEQELAKKWIGLPEGFIEKALRLSSSFRTRKGSNGQLMIRLT